MSKSGSISYRTLCNGYLVTQDCFRLVGENTDEGKYETKEWFCENLEDVVQQMINSVKDLTNV